MKRFAIITALLVTVLLGLLAGIVCFFNINDYSDLISEQLEKSTGYQVSFALIEHNGGWPLHFSISDVAVAIDENSRLHIDKINIDIGKLALWERQLDIDRVALLGIDIYMEEAAFKKILSGSKSTINPPDETKNSQLLPWSGLRINQLRISDFNAHLRYAGKELRLQRASLSADNLPLIEHKQLAVPFCKGSLQFSAQKLRLQLPAEQVVTLEQLALNSTFDLPEQQAKLTLALKKLEVAFPRQAALTFKNAQLDMQLAKNKLRLTHLFFNAFSGELQLQADALLSINRSATVPWSVNSVTVETLLLKDMKVKIPSFIAPAENIALNNTQQTEKLPIKTLFIKNAALQNIDISSEERQIPLTVNGLNARLQEFYLLHNSQLFDLSEYAQPSASFALQFAYLQWADRLVEQFQVTGSFAENAPETQLLRQFYRDQSTKD